MCLNTFYHNKTLVFITEVPPSFYDMGNAISSLIGQHGVEGARLDEDSDENVLLSEEHSLVLTCCWVSLKVQLLDDLSKLFHISDDDLVLCLSSL